MKFCIIISTLFFITLNTWADTKEFYRDYTYIAGEADSKISARKMAIQEVKRELLNEIGTYIYSKIIISENSQGKKDTKLEIRAISAGFVRVYLLEEKWNGYSFYVKARLDADPKKILKRIKELSSNETEKSKLKERLIEKEKEFDELYNQMVALKRSLIEKNTKSLPKKSSVSLVKKLNMNSKFEIFEEGEDYYWPRKGKVRNFESALKLYHKAAELGHAEAQNQLGYMYSAGEGIEKDYYESIYWYLKSARQGNSKGQYSLVKIYRYGIGVPKNDKKSKYWAAKFRNQ